MNSLLIRIYDLITAPLYRRLARDLTIQLQTISKDYIDYQERIATRFIDELVKVNLRLDSQEGSMRAIHSVREELEPTENNGSYPQYSEELIHEILLEVKNSPDLVSVCQKRNLPIATVVEWQLNYLGMDSVAMRKMRMLEQTNFELQCMLTDLSKENKQLKERAATLK